MQAFPAATSLAKATAMAATRSRLSMCVVGKCPPCGLVTRKRCSLTSAAPHCSSRKLELKGGHTPSLYSCTAHSGAHILPRVPRTLFCACINCCKWLYEHRVSCPCQGATALLAADRDGTRRTGCNRHHRGSKAMRQSARKRGCKRHKKSGVASRSRPAGAGSRPSVASAAMSSARSPPSE